MEQKVTLRDFAKLFGSRRALAVSAVSSALIILFAWLVGGTLLASKSRSAYAEARRRSLSSMPTSGRQFGHPRGTSEQREIAEPMAAEFGVREAVRGAGARFELQEDEPAREYPVELRPNGPEGEADFGGSQWSEPEAPPAEEPFPEDSSFEE